MFHDWQHQKFSAGKTFKNINIDLTHTKHFSVLFVSDPIQLKEIRAGRVVPSTLFELAEFFPLIKMFTRKP
jgi:hypothetical protein